jgi:hypothetical protein
MADTARLDKLQQIARLRTRVAERKAQAAASRSAAANATAAQAKAVADAVAVEAVRQIREARATLLQGPFAPSAIHEVRATSEAAQGAILDAEAAHETATMIAEDREFERRQQAAVLLKQRGRLNVISGLFEQAKAADEAAHERAALEYLPKRQER